MPGGNGGLEWLYLLVKNKREPKCAQKKQTTGFFFSSKSVIVFCFAFVEEMGSNTHSSVKFQNVAYLYFLLTLECCSLVLEVSDRVSGIL